MTLRYPPYVAGGYELLTRDAVEGLRARGHDVVVLTGHGARFDGTPDVLPWLQPDLDGAVDPLQASLTAGNAERFRLHFFRGANLRATARALRREAPDALLFFNLGLVSLAPVLAARVAGVPTLGYLADPWPRNHWVQGWRHHAEGAGDADGKRLRLSLLERAWRSFRDTMGLGPLCVCSDYLRRVLVDDGIPAADMRVLPPALFPEVAALTRERMVRERSPGEPLRLICTSSLWEGKGQDVLLEALARAREVDRGIELVLASDGEAAYRVHLEGLVRSLGLEGVVRFTGWLEREALSREMRDASILVMPSRWGEPFGLATIEGMAHGLAVVASDAGASPELIEEGVDGILTAAGDAAALAAALLRMARDEGLRQALARCGMQRVGERYTRELFAAGLERALGMRAGEEA